MVVLYPCRRISYVLCLANVAQWLKHGAFPILLPAVRFRIPLCAEYSDKYHVSLNIGTLFRCCVLGKGNEYLVGQRWHVYDKFNARKWLQDCMLSVELKLHTNQQVQ